LSYNQLINNSRRH